MKILALTTVSGPYITARYSAFSSLLNEHEFSLLELGRVSKTYQWKVEQSTVPYRRMVLSEKPVESQSTFKLAKLVFRALNQLQPDCLIICGYGVSGMLPALAWSIWQGKPAILLSETTEADFQRSWWRELIKRWIIKQYRAALVGGHPHQRYLVKLGMPAEAIFLGYDVVGNNSFHPENLKGLSTPLPKPYFLSINRFVTKKNLPFLISAYAAYRTHTGSTSWDLVLCGDGELRPQLEQQITNLGLGDCVHLPGFLQQEQLLPYLAHAGCFIHASIQEQWGLVVNEAMAAGLPVLVSNRCGCFEDLVIEGINGFGFDPESPEQLAQLMVKISSGAIDLETMGKASLQHIQKFSPDYFAQSLMQAVNYAVEHY